jgi:hypothetical protein
MKQQSSWSLICRNVIRIFCQFFTSIRPLYFYGSEFSYFFSFCLYINLLHILPNDFDGEGRGRLFFRVIANHPLTLRDILEEGILNKISCHVLFQSIAGDHKYLCAVL